MPSYKIVSLARGQMVKGPAAYYANDNPDKAPSRQALRELELVNTGQCRIEDLGSYYARPQTWSFKTDAIVLDEPEFNMLGEIHP